MKDIKKIVVGFDFSDVAKAALLKALEFADRFDARVFVVHAISPEIASPFVPSVEMDLQKIVEDNLSQQMKLFLTKTGHAIDRVSIHVLQGLPYACLIEFAESKKADLIVVGSHSRSLLGRFFLGSQALKVVRLAPTSVYVHHTELPRVVQKILVPIDENPSSELAIAEAKVMAKFYNAKLQLVNVVNLPVYDYVDSQLLIAEAKKECRKYLEGLNREHQLDCPPLVLEGIPAQALRQHIVSDEEVGLIVLVTHGRKGLDRFLMGSVAEQIVQHAPIPVVAIRTPDQKKHASYQLAKGLLF